MSPHPIVLVLGAAGGCGASTVACGLALASARAGRAPCLLELDLERGDLAGELGVASERGLADLVAVAGELAPEHVRQAAFPHASGMAVVFAPGRPGAGDDWDGPALARLTEVIARDRVCVVDAGPAVPAPAVLAAATTVLLVAPRTIGGARRVRRLAGALARRPHPARRRPSARRPGAGAQPARPRAGRRDGGLRVPAPAPSATPPTSPVAAGRAGAARRSATPWPPWPRSPDERSSDRGAGRPPAPPPRRRARRGAGTRCPRPATWPATSSA